jgi:hypothetical protein
MGDPARATGEDRTLRARRLDGVVDAKASAYELRSGAEPLLHRAPDLRTFLEETCAEIRKVFGAATELAVTSFEDPEEPEGKPSLFLLVRTTLDATTAGDLLDRFDEAWWLDNAPRAEGKIEVSLEFA